jgi:hypothetical protein
MYFSGSRYQKIVTSDIPKHIVFEYNVSTFRGKEYVKGFVRDIVYDKTAGKFATEEIALNNLEMYSYPDISANVTYLSFDDTQKIIDENEEYGTLFIANSYLTLAKYKGVEKLDTSVFILSSKDLSDSVLISPLYDSDLSGYNRIVYLDKPFGVKIPSLGGKKVYICNDVDGNDWTNFVETDRESLLSVFKILSANAANLDGTNGLELVEKNNLTSSKLQSLFAIKVFEELKLISFEKGRLNVFKGVKTQLDNSPLYRLAKEK